MTASDELIKAVFDAMAMVYERHPEYTGLYLSVDRLVQVFRSEQTLTRYTMLSTKGYT